MKPSAFKTLTALALAFLVLSSANLHGQGFVIFSTDGGTSPPGPGPRVLTYVNGPPAYGSAWYAQLYAAEGANQSEIALHAVGMPVNLRGTSSTSTTAGYVQFSGTSHGALGDVPVTPGGAVQVTTSQLSGPVTLQIRAWDSRFTSAENAPLFVRSVTFNFTPAYLPDLPLGTGLTGLGIPDFALSLSPPTPEPGTIYLVSFGALLLFRFSVLKPK